MRELITQTWYGNEHVHYVQGNGITYSVPCGDDCPFCKMLEESKYLEEYQPLKPKRMLRLSP